MVLPITPLPSNESFSLHEIPTGSQCNVDLQ